MLAVVGTLAVWAVTCKGDSGGPPIGGTPQVDVGADFRAQPSQTVSFSARIAIPSSANPSAYHWTLAWGDGTTDEGTVGSGGLVTATHSYTGVNAYHLRLSAQGPGAADTASDTSTVYVDAPGVNIISAYPDNRYAMVSGTSFSAPMVAAEAALVMAVKTTSAKTVIGSATVNVDAQNAAFVGKLGHGRVDVLNAVKP